MSLKARINDDMKSAMPCQGSRAAEGDRLLLAAIKQREVDERVELTDSDVLAVIDKMLKQRVNPIAQFERAGRTDLVDAEKAEVAVLQAYTPQPLSGPEIEALVNEAIQAANARHREIWGL